MLYFDDNAEINLDEIYTKSIGEIDKFRSRNYIYKQELSIDNIFKTSSTGSTEQPFSAETVYKKETRAHCFYRLLGLPITDGTKLFNPGFDPDSSKDDEKITISNSYIKLKTYQLYQSHFDKVNSILDVFDKKDITTTVLLLSTINKRKLGDSIADPTVDPLNMSIENLKYSVDMTDGSFVPYDQYTYIDQEVNLPPGLSKDRYRFIFPIIPDPKMCFAVNSKCQVYVPFFLKKGPDSPEEFQFSAAGIDQIFKERFQKERAQNDLTATEAEAKEIVSKFKETLSSNSNNYSKKDIESVTKSSGEFISNKNEYYLNFIKNGTKILKLLKENIKKATFCQQKYNLLPITDSSSPEIGNLSIKPIYALDPRNTELDKEIVLKVKLSAAENIKQMFYKSDEKKETVNPKNEIAAIVSTVSPGSQEKVQQKEKDLGQLKTERKSHEESICQSIKYIEYLMGEFSGFGIIDMYVVTSAFYLLDDGVLASFLDDGAFSRAKDPDFNLNVPDKSVSVVEAYKKLAETIKILYLTLDTIYLSLE